MRPEPFHWRAPETALDDLRRRLEATRWPAGAAGEEAGWGQGFPPSRLREICAYWAEGFDWRRQETAMFGWPHYQIQMGACRVHFVHVPAERAAAPALLLSHGWPGSFLEFLELIPRLRDFHLVIPSLLGFGFSPHPGTAGCNAFLMAELWTELMGALGYQRFYAQGGDFGASVSTALGWKHAPQVLGVHLNYIPSSYRPHDSAHLSAAEQAGLARGAAWYERYGGYAHVQRTEPRTLAYGLEDSPAGLGAWMLQRFFDWSGGGLRQPERLDELLAQVTLYWLTQTVGSSMRLYGETAAAPLQLGAGERVGVPCAVARFRDEAPFPERAWVERGYHLVRWTEFDRGGHFAALEEPELLAGDVRAFVEQTQA